MTRTTEPTPTDLPPVPFDETGILDRLAALRAADAPTHGGHVLSYVYDPGLERIDRLAAEAIRAVQPVNGLDPTTFTSVAVMEREVVAFARAMLHGDDEIVGTITSSGTESCLLAVKTARDRYRAAHPHGPCRVVAPVTVHAAFRKAASYLGVELSLVPVSPAGEVDPTQLVARLGDDVALVVISAPSYPHGAIDPVPEVAAAASARGIPVHVDACVGGWILPFWAAAGGAQIPPFDFAVPGVTSISADIHKYGYVPKGTSALLVRGRDLQRRQFFATTNWPGYPVVNATMAGSRSAGPLAAAWAVTQALGTAGYTALAARCVSAAGALRACIGELRGLRVVGTSPGPLIAVATDPSVPEAERVDPHVWVDEARALGWLLQSQPGIGQDDGPRLPHTAHLTVTPVTAQGLPELTTALATAADRARGVPRPDVSGVLGALGGARLGSSDEIWATLSTLLLADGMPSRQAPLLALVEALPHPVAERMLTELVARFSEVEALTATPGDRRESPSPATAR